MLCSDGFWEPLSDADIAALLETPGPADCSGRRGPPRPRSTPAPPTTSPSSRCGRTAEQSRGNACTEPQPVARLARPLPIVGLRRSHCTPAARPATSQETSMPRRQHPRAVKFCAHCGSGYDGFKAMELRGRYCSPVCLAAARAAHRAGRRAPPGQSGAAPRPVTRGRAAGRSRLTIGQTPAHGTSLRSALRARLPGRRRRRPRRRQRRPARPQRRRQHRQPRSCTSPGRATRSTSALLARLRLRRLRRPAAPGQADRRRASGSSSSRWRSSASSSATTRPRPRASSACTSRRR